MKTHHLKSLLRPLALAPIQKKVLLNALALAPIEIKVLPTGHDIHLDAPGPSCLHRWVK